MASKVTSIRIPEQLLQVVRILLKGGILKVELPANCSSLHSLRMSSHKDNKPF